MLLLKITGMALLVAPAMAAYCDDLIGTTPEYFKEVKANKDGLPGCGTSRCIEYGNWVGRTWSKTQVCEDNGMRLCTIQELQAGHAVSTGCDFDDYEIWSSSECGEGKRWTYLHRTRESECRKEDKGKSIKCCADFKPEPEPTPEPTPKPTPGPCAFHVSNQCRYLLTKSNGSCPPFMKLPWMREDSADTIRAECVLCSGCDYYKVDQANEQASRSYLRNNPHCARCRKLGKRTAIRKTEDFSGPYGDIEPWNCLRSYSIPATCIGIDYRSCHRLQEADDRRKCEKYYNTL